MTVLLNVGRRIPRSWFRQAAHKAKGFMSFQENIWLIVKQSMNMAKRKANASGKLKFNIVYDKEIEDLNYEIEWMKIIIQGTKEQEKEEFEEAMMMYQPLGNILKKEIPKNDNMKKHLKSRVLSPIKVEEAYNKGFGSMSDNNISNKLLEMGIITHIEWIEDFGTREPIFIN